MIEAFVDGAVHRLSGNHLSPEYHVVSNAYVAIYAPNINRIWVYQLDIPHNNIGAFAIESEMIAIKKAIDLGFTIINSDCKTAIHQSELIYKGITFHHVYGHKRVEESTEKEMIMRIPHLFANKGIVGNGIITHSFPISRGWIKTLEWNNEA